MNKVYLVTRKVTRESQQLGGQRAVSTAQFGALLTLPHSAYAAVLKVCSDVPDAQKVDPEFPDVLLTEWWV